MIITNKELPPRIENDVYPTPVYTVQSGLDLLLRENPALLPGYPYGQCPVAYVLDPGAGGGVWGEQARKLWPTARFVGADLRELPKSPWYDDWLTGDLTEETAFPNLRDLYGGPHGFNLVMGNPPYYAAEAFVRGGLDVLREGGYLLYLMRMAFSAGQRRRDDLFASFPYKWEGKCSKRPSFYGKGTNATDYSLFLWQKGWKGVPQVRFLR